MSQIKKKFIADKAIDGSKILLQNGEALKALSTSGSEQSLMSFSSGNALVFGVVPEVGSDPSSGNQLVRKAYVDSQVSGEESRAMAAEQALSARLDGLELDSTTSTYVDNLNAATNARINDILSNVDPAALDSLSEIVTAFQQADGDLSAAITAVLGTHTSELAAEVARATAEEARIEGLVSAEQSRASAEEMRIEDNLIAEGTRATLEEARIEAKLDQEISDRHAAIQFEQGLRSQEMLTEITARTEADNGIYARLQVIEGGGPGSVLHATLAAQSYADMIVADEQSARESADSALDARLDVIEGSDTVEGSVAKAEKDSKDYTDTKVAQEASDRATAVSLEQAARIAGDADLQGQVDAEESRAMGEEARIEGKVDQEISDRQAAVSSEQSRAEGEEERIEGRLDQEVLDRQADVDAEEQRAMGEESRIEGRLDQEISDRQAAVSAEQSAREFADSGLQSQINTEKGRIDAILLAADADKDSFAEIVTVINGIDMENDMSFAAYVTSNNAALAQEISDRQAAVSAEQSARQSADSALDARLDILEGSDSQAGSVAKALKDAKAYTDQEVTSEETRAMAAESALDGRLDVLETDPTTKSYVDQQMAAEQLVRDSEVTGLGDRLDILEGAESVVGSLAKALKDAKDYTDAEVAQEVSDREAAMSAEQSARQSADNALDARLDILEGADTVSGSVAKALKDAKAYTDQEVSSEETRAMGEESRIEGKVNQEVSDRQAAVSAEQSARQSADSALDVRIDALEVVEHRHYSTTLTAQDISNGYITLSQEVIPLSETVFVGRLVAHMYSDYVITTVSGLSRITWTGELASGGASALVAGDKVVVRYMK